MITTINRTHRGKSIMLNKCQCKNKCVNVQITFVIVNILKIILRSSNL